MNWIGHLESERVQVCFVNLILVALHFSQLRWDVPLLISKSFTNEVTHHVKSPSTNYKNQVPKGVNECVTGYHHTSSPFFPHAFQHTVSFWCITVTVTQCCTRILNKPFQLIIWFITKNPYGSSIGVVKAISQQYFCLAMLFDKKLTGCKKTWKYGNIPWRFHGGLEQFSKNERSVDFISATYLRVLELILRMLMLDRKCNCPSPLG